MGDSAQILLHAAFMLHAVVICSEDIAALMPLMQSQIIRRNEDKHVLKFGTVAKWLMLFPCSRVSRKLFQTEQQHVTSLLIWKLSDNLVSPLAKKVMCSIMSVCWWVFVCHKVCAKASSHTVFLGNLD